MPNWVYNVWRIKGDKQYIDQIESMVDTEGDVFFMNVSPPASRKLDADNVSWRIEHWGTKCEACVVTAERQDERWLNIMFFTAWNFPHPIFAEIAKRFPYVKMTASYAENSIGFNCGTAIGRDGSTILFPKEDESEEARAMTKALWGDTEKNIEEEKNNA